MKCRRAARLIAEESENQAGNLTPGLQDHLRACPDCSRLLEELRESWRLLAEHPGIDPSPEFASRLRARLSAEEPKPEPGWGREFWCGWRWAALAACALLLAIAIAYRVVPPSPQVWHGEPAVAADPWDDQFLEDLERTLRGGGEFLRDYDSWPVDYLDASAPAGDPAKKETTRIGGPRHESA